MALFPPPPPSRPVEQGPTSGYFSQQERAYFSRPGREVIRLRDGPRSPHERDREHDRNRGKHRHNPMPALPPHSTAPPTVFIPPSTRTHMQGSHSPLLYSPSGRPLPTPVDFAYASRHSGQPPSHSTSSSGAHRLPPGGVTTISIPPAHTPVPGHTASTHGQGPPLGSAPPMHSYHGPPHPTPTGPGHWPSEHDPGYQLHSHDLAHRRSSRDDGMQPDQDQAWRRAMPPSERRRAGKHTKRVIVK
jgi:hypothetical protein